MALTIKFFNGLKRLKDLVSVGYIPVDTKPVKGSMHLVTSDAVARIEGGSGASVFGSLQDAISDADSLSVGDIFETNGFYTAGDGGGVIGNNLYDNSSPTILSGYVSEPSADHPTGLFTLNNSTQVSLAIPITSYMEGKTIRISAASTSHNRWKIGKHTSLPVNSYTDITYLANTYTTDSGRDYTDINIGTGESGGYILMFFGSGISTTDFTDSVMACESPYYTPYESYSGGTTTYIVQLKTALINLDELVTALNLRGNSLN